MDAPMTVAESNAATDSANIRPIHKILAANRSEIATRVFRSAHELGIR
ncbi:biotin carboxylase N-terminal domain-containing protein, partial [Rhodopirellula bahusiensis]